MVKAVVVLNSSEGVNGTVYFTQKGDGLTTVTGSLSGLKPGAHDFHVHALGDTTNGCMSTIPLSRPHSIIGRAAVVHANSDDCFVSNGVELKDVRNVDLLTLISQGKVVEFYYSTEFWYSFKSNDFLKLLCSMEPQDAFLKGSP
ncbi:hypothetical protein RHMOL_Rhmol06G0113600 [Rhododendron molle]|uniref:Uncharacterized protein n=1 Tax=Rhododendron molle TaxID=49168 RepID=A0ACC0NDF0_RHOML|nr:hypothetical protein RHMOL_Rhmol06G0113600 [Rhododendron molle]